MLTKAFVHSSVTFSLNTKNPSQLIKFYVQNCARNICEKSAKCSKINSEGKFLVNPCITLETISQ